jgi:hypothetical protein
LKIEQSQVKIHAPKVKIPKENNNEKNIIPRVSGIIRIVEKSILLTSYEIMKTIPSN